MITFRILKCSGRRNVCYILWLNIQFRSYGEIGFREYVCVRINIIVVNMLAEYFMFR